jgi:hypothetical protein
MTEVGREAHGRTEPAVTGNGERRRKTCQRNNTSKSNTRGEDATVSLEAFGQDGAAAVPPVKRQGGTDLA